MDSLYVLIEQAKCKAEINFWILLVAMTVLSLFTGGRKRK